MMRPAIIGTLILLCGVGSAGADIYQWKDRQGTVGFSDDPSHIPPQYRKSARQVDPQTLPRSFSIVPSPPPGAPAPAPRAADASMELKKTVFSAQSDLENLRNERQKAEEQKVDLIRQGWFQYGFYDVGTLGATLQRIRDLDQQIREREAVLSFMSDESRRGGLAPSFSVTGLAEPRGEGQIDFTTSRLMSTGMSREDTMKLAGPPTPASFGGCLYCSTEWIYRRDDGWLVVITFSGDQYGQFASYPSAKLACESSPRPAGISSLCE